MDVYPKLPHEGALLEGVPSMFNEPTPVPEVNSVKKPQEELPQLNLELEPTHEGHVYNFADEDKTKEEQRGRREF